MRDVAEILAPTFLCTSIHALLYIFLVPCSYVEGMWLDSGHWDVGESEADHFWAWSLVMFYITFACSSLVLAILKSTCYKWPSYEMEENSLTHTRFFTSKINLLYKATGILR